MNENLFFVPIIANALQEPNIEEALRKAFCQIKKMSTEKRYFEGFANFELFMNTAYNRYEITTTDQIHELIVHLGMGMFEGTTQEKETMLDIVASHPEWKVEYEAFCQIEADKNLMREFPVIEVSSDKGFVIRNTFEKVPGHESFEGLLPGKYKIKLVNTGWIIWEGKLTAKELIWTALDMAADTRGTQKRHTNKIDLLNNKELILRTFAGREMGRIEIELTG